MKTVNYMVYTNTSGAYEGGDDFVLCAKHLDEEVRAGTVDETDVYGTTEHACFTCEHEGRSKP